MDSERRAERARALLSDDLLQEVITEIRDRQISAFRGCDPADLEGMQQARLRLWAIEQVVTGLNSIVTTHKLKHRK